MPGLVSGVTVSRQEACKAAVIVAASVNDCMKLPASVDTAAMVPFSPLVSVISEVAELVAAIVALSGIAMLSIACDSELIAAMVPLSASVRRMSAVSALEPAMVPARATCP